MQDEVEQMTGPQERTLDSLRGLLEATGADFRIDASGWRRAHAAVYEIRIDGTHWGFVSIGYDGSVDL